MPSKTRATGKSGKKEKVFPLLSAIRECDFGTNFMHGMIKISFDV
jgi:hypothetical protein